MVDGLDNPTRGEWVLSRGSSGPSAHSSWLLCISGKLVDGVWKKYEDNVCEQFVQYQALSPILFIDTKVSYV
jgi:hypothetical protein